MTTQIAYKNKKIPDKFNGFVIAQISDLHNKEFGREQNILLNKLKKTNPDIIVVTGDLIDRRKYNLDKAMEFINGALKIAPVYYVSGNHEAWSNKYEDIEQSLLKAGVIILNDSKTQLIVDKDKINLIGLSDPDFLTTSYSEGTNVSAVEDKLINLTDNSSFNILLSHRPELIKTYAKAGVDLAFTGHAHGGQFRLPLVGGLFAPDQGLFPHYTSGSYTVNSTTEIVSRGLGNSLMPIRLFNRPEIVVVTLKNE